MGILELLVPFYPISTAWVVFSSDLKMDPLNLYPTFRLHSVRNAVQPFQIPAQGPGSVHRQLLCIKSWSTNTFKPKNCNYLKIGHNFFLVLPTF